jgi:hypothetical protein
MANKGSGAGDKISESRDGILPPLDDSVLNDIFARLGDFSGLDEILPPWDDSVFNDIFGRLDGMQNPLRRHAAAKTRHRGRGRHT